MRDSRFRYRHSLSKAYASFKSMPFFRLKLLEVFRETGYPYI
ncbi:hypothetical protein HMPREF1981_02776 [Bacteroides pyogenes F0041]|uniref:Uncharacterized protein n=1 Tax=Bacteroides pyogenes F0041 TaxID=1321819 RepID=U2DK99_9BACE|nr:hypothetical protein HMPREF1981_02776 [Bacteroides pyogenes F0041]